MNTTTTTATSSSRQHEIMSAALRGQLHKLPIWPGETISPAAKKTQNRAFMAHLESAAHRPFRTLGRALRANRRARTDWVQDCRVW